MNPNRRRGEEDLVGAQEEKTVIRIYYVTKNLFSIKGKNPSSSICRCVVRTFNHRVLQ